MNSEVSKYWFPAKRYGWGWGLPLRWQGWAVLLVLALSLLLAARIWMPQEPDHFVMASMGLAALLFVVCWWKGEPTSWRWGDKD